MDINTISGSLPPAQPRQAVTPTGHVEFRPLAQHENTQPATKPVDKQSAPEQSREALEELVDELQDATKVMQRNLNFSIDENTGVTVIKVTDGQSGDVIRQMPTEEALRLAERLGEMRSLLFETKA